MEEYEIDAYQIFLDVCYGISFIDMYMLTKSLLEL